MKNKFLLIFLLLMILNLVIISFSFSQYLPQPILPEPPEPIPTPEPGLPPPRPIEPIPPPQPIPSPPPASPSPTFLSFPQNPFPPLINCGDDFFECLGFFFRRILEVIIALALVLAAIFIGWAGILYITQSGSKEKSKEINQKIIWATVGLIVALMAYAFVRMLEIWIRTPSI